MTAAASLSLRDNLDRTCKFFEDGPKNCIKTLRYTTEWAVRFFENLASYPQVTNAISAFKQGTAIFIWPEFLTDMNTFRLKTIDWLNPGKHKATAKQVSLAASDALNKVCDLVKWLVDARLLTVATPLMTAFNFINGLTLVYSFGNRTITTFSELRTCAWDDISVKMWKLAKNVALVSLGLLVSIASITSFFSPIAMLICSTASLVASYGVFILEHPIADSSQS